jgi:hypothetical protein
MLRGRPFAEWVEVREAERKANFRVQISEGGGGGSGSRRKGKFQSSDFRGRRWGFGKQKERQISEFRISEGGGGGSGSRRKGKFQSSGFQREEVGAGCGGGTCG